MSNANIVSRLPYPGEQANSRGINEKLWGVLTNITFPNSNIPEAILGAHDLATLKGLDLISGHIAIVQQSRKVGRDWESYETSWLTLKALIYTAHKTGSFAGIESVKFGPIIEKTYQGFYRENGKNKEAEKTIQFPEYAEATVYRFVQGQKCTFKDVVYFEEAVPLTQGLPTMIWQKKPALMLAKCAKSAVLRLAFAECDFSAEEMDGQAAIIDIVPEISERDDERTSMPHTDDQGEVSNDNAPVRTLPETAEFDAAIASFKDMPSEDLKWIDRHLQTAISLGAYDTAQDGMHESLDAAAHPLGKEVFKSAQCISQNKDSEKLWNYIFSAKKHGGDAFERAIRNTQTQVEKNGFDSDAANAMITVLTFFEASAAA